MSYLSIATNVDDKDFQNRVTAAAAKENREGSNSPQTVMHRMIWAVCSASDIEAAYESALAAENPNPGGDESVVTDGMILSAVQANWPENIPPLV